MSYVTCRSAPPLGMIFLPSIYEFRPSHPVLSNASLIASALGGRMSYLSQLRTFVDVCRWGSISKAAVRLGISQATASAHVQAIEALYGKRLLVRGPSGIEATSAAEDLVERIANHLDALEMEIGSRMSQNSSKTVRWVDLLIQDDLFDETLMPFLRSLTATLPRLRLLNGSERACVERLHHGTIDIAIVLLPQKLPGYETIRVKSLDYAYLILKNGRTSVIDIMSAEFDLNVSPLIVYDGIRADVMHALTQRHPVDPLATMIEVDSARAAHSLVASGLGWSLLPTSYCEQENRNISASLSQGNVQRDVFFLWNIKSTRRDGMAKLKRTLVQLLSGNGR